MPLLSPKYRHMPAPVQQKQQREGPTRLLNAVTLAGSFQRPSACCALAAFCLCRPLYVCRSSRRRGGLRTCMQCRCLPLRTLCPLPVPLPALKPCGSRSRRTRDILMQCRCPLLNTFCPLCALCSLLLETLQEQKKKELEDLDAVLAELGLEAQAKADSEAAAAAAASNKAAKRKAKKAAAGSQPAAANGAGADAAAANGEPENKVGRPPARVPASLHASPGFASRCISRPQSLPACMCFNTAQCGSAPENEPAGAALLSMLASPLLPCTQAASCCALPAHKSAPVKPASARASPCMAPMNLCVLWSRSCHVRPLTGAGAADPF